MILNIFSTTKIRFSGKNFFPVFILFLSKPLAFRAMLMYIYKAFLTKALFCYEK